MAFVSCMNAENGLVDAVAAKEVGLDLTERYAQGDPYPHIMIDDFLPESVARMFLAEFDRLPRDDDDSSVLYDRPTERLKRQFNPDHMSPAARYAFYSFNSLPFVRILGNITGIEGLIPDPYFRGGGFHEISTGGHLSIHADFNRHYSLPLERRINLLIYLNEDWQPEFGGQLELWANDMSRCVQAITPLFNRAVIFNTTSHSNHGNPQPVQHPENRSRKSIALYYYTATWDSTKRRHTTQFRARPETQDRVDWSVKARELLADLTPPLLRRSLNRSKP